MSMFIYGFVTGGLTAVLLMALIVIVLSYLAERDCARLLREMGEDDVRDCS
jgi:hypothetical protein